MARNELCVGLIRGRHPLPVDEYIIDEEIQALDFERIHHLVASFIAERCAPVVSSSPSLRMNYAGDSDVLQWSSDVTLRVYVTGLTAVTAEVISLCALNGVSLVLMHFDASTGGYVEQPLF